MSQLLETKKQTIKEKLYRLADVLRDNKGVQQIQYQLGYGKALCVLGLLATKAGIPRDEWNVKSIFDAYNINSSERDTFLDYTNDNLRYRLDHLVTLNDHDEKSFDEIADLLERTADKL